MDNNDAKRERGDYGGSIMYTPMRAEQFESYESH